MDGGALWQLALDVARRSIDAIGKASGGKKAEEVRPPKEEVIFKPSIEQTAGCRGDLDRQRPHVGISGCITGDPDQADE